MKYVLVFSLLLTALIAPATASTALAQDAAVPPTLQAAIFKKVFMLNQTLTSKGKFTVLVVDNEAGQAPAMVEAFNKAGITARAVPVDEVKAVLDATSVVYLLPGSETVHELSRDRQVFTITGTVALAEAGQAAVGLTLEGGKPKIVVNQSRLEAEGQEISPDLMRLATVI